MKTSPTLYFSLSLTSLLGSTPSSRGGNKHGHNILLSIRRVRVRNTQPINNFLQPRVTSQTPHLRPRTLFIECQLLTAVLKCLCSVHQTHGVDFELVIFGLLLQNVYFRDNIQIDVEESQLVLVGLLLRRNIKYDSDDDRGYENLLRSFRLLGAARIEWMIGYENLPSVKSSQNPLFAEYYQPQ